MKKKQRKRDLLEKIDNLERMISRFRAENHDYRNKYECTLFARDEAYAIIRNMKKTMLSYEDFAKRSGINIEIDKINGSLNN